MAGTLLIVDDEPSVRRGLRSIFESLGFAVVEAASLADAERALAGTCVTVALVDLSLSGAHGREGLDFVSGARARGFSAPIVIFTAFGSDEARNAALARGAVDLWSKSISIEDLVARVLALGGLAATRP